MPSTHVSLRYHVTFSTKNRFPFIAPGWRFELHDYLGGCLRGLGGSPLQIGGVEDHVHLLFGLRPTITVSEIVREVKKAATAWVHESFDRKFLWQEGYGAFTVGRREVSGLTEYIAGQQEHHRHRSFQDEYRAFLLEEGIPFDERFLW